MKKRSGFTLIELIVVIAILGIAISIVAPNTNFFKAMKESLEIKELKRDMLYARNRAILDSKDYTITFDVERNSYTIDRGIGDLRILLSHKVFKHGTVLNSKEQNTFSIVFKANGTVGGSGSTSYNDRLGDRYKISISPVAYGVSIIEYESNNK